MNEGWVKLHRKILKWEWATTPNTFHLFIHLLLMANHEEKKWQGHTVKKGELITGLYSLSEQTGLTVRELRTSLSHLCETGEITQKTTNKYRVITIVKYGDYQIGDKISTINRQATDKQPTTNKNEENYKNEKKEDIPYSAEFLKFWETYPKKKGKTEAWKAWQALRPSPSLQETILRAVESQKKSPQWLRDGGQYIKNAQGWLNGRRWEDEVEQLEGILKL